MNAIGQLRNLFGLALGILTGASTLAAPFPLVADHHAATLVTSPADHAVVAIATTDLAGDIARITGVRPAIADTLPPGVAFDPAVHGHWSRHVGDEPLVTVFVRS